MNKLILSLRGSMGRFYWFHILWNVLALLLLLAIGNFAPGSIKFSSEAQTVTGKFLAFAPYNFLFWLALASFVFAGMIYSFWAIAMISGMTMRELADQFKAKDNNESPSIFFKAFAFGLVLTLGKVALFGIGGTIWMIAMRLLLYNLGVAVVSVATSRGFAGVRSFDEWRTSFVESGTDGPTRMAELACYIIGGIGFLVP